MNALADAVLLDARTDVASTREKILRTQLGRVAIRRCAGLLVTWYSLAAAEVLKQLADKDEQASLTDALQLRQRAANPVLDIAGRVRREPNANLANASDTIILDGSRFVGIQVAGSRPQPPLGEPDAFARTAGVKSGPLSAQQTRSSGTRSAPRARSGEQPVSEAFIAYPRLDTPATVTPRQAFTLRVGVGRQAQAGTVGGPLDITLPAGSKRFELELIVVAEGFAMPAGCRHRLTVEGSRLDAHQVEVSLIAPDIDGEPLLSTISVVYFFASMPCGMAARRIAVLAAEQPPFGPAGASGLPWTEQPAMGSAVTVRAGTPAVDLTVIISKPDGNPAGGQYVWSFQSPHDVDLPAQPIVADLGTDGRDLGSHIIDGVQKAEGLDMVTLKMGGLGRNIAERMPAAFWNLLREVAAAVGAATPGRKPAVLLLTAEAHVPWELARMALPLDPAAPPYLGCQVDIGRWPLNDSGNPALPPAASIDVHQMAVVVGDYAARSGWRNLENARKEGEAIESRYQAIPLTAAACDIKQLLYAQLAVGDSRRGAEAVHFACHGEAIQGHPLDAAVILDDGQHLDPDYLTDSPLGAQNRPFLFLNACQVGKAGELLGSFSGFAGESLKGGFRGFLAPLWSVDDAIARDIAVEFYERVFGTAGSLPETVGSVLRDLRRRFDPDQEKNSSTRLAYVFYGHPSLTLNRLQEN